jgi:hypothetical protein
LSCSTETATKKILSKKIYFITYVLERFNLDIVWRLDSNGTRLLAERQKSKILIKVVTGIERRGKNIKSPDFKGLG